MLVVRKITDLIPNQKIDARVQIPESVKLADPNFNVPGKIDILIGAEYFYDIIKPGKLNAKSASLTLQDSVFGYILGGSISSPDNLNSNYCGLICGAEELNSNLRKFWEIEEIGNELPKSKENAICEEHYARTHRRDQTGKYTVTMPFKEHWSCLGYSRDIALNRLASLWTRLSRDQEYLKLYRDFLKEYEDLGHMTEIRESVEPEVTYYMPHHGIYRPQKSTTKLRTVFNASTLTTSGKSLNSIQYNGGVIQDELFTLLVRFRKHIFAFTADIRQMYRRINIDESQRKLQRILWKEDVNKPIKTYQLNTVTYGTVSAPYLAMRTLKQISIDDGKNFPIAASVLCNDFYMDDVLSGANTLEAAKTLQHQLIDILKTAQMSLHKWCGNTSELIPTTENEYDFSSTDEIKTLGIAWKARTDCFTFKVKVEQNAHPIKRSVLSIIARLFDPLGLLGPVITKAKIFMQQLWLLKIDWSEMLPEKEACEWQEFVKSLINLNDINIERCIVIQSAVVTELHGFCDASEKAYGAAIYARTVTAAGEVKVKLVASKSRVSPIKQVTIPRLELCSAVLLTKLMDKVQRALKMDITSVFYWSDSTIVISWMKKESRDLKTFVANRVVFIQECTEINQWHHVPSEQNPADIISRGLDPERIQQSDLWWFGPSFLQERLVNLASDSNDIHNSELYQRELKNNQGDSVCLLMQDIDILPIINGCSSFVKLQRIIAWCVRFKENARNPLQRTTGSLTAPELSASLFCLVRNVQSVYFSKEIQCIKKGQQLHNSSNLLNLSPFLDEKNILRVGGRLRHSNLPAEQKHPMLIPNNNPICDLIINHFHVFYFHTGIEATLANIRTQFWIINGRSTVKRVIAKCLKCLKVSAKGKNQMMADLPSARVNISRVYTKVGLDFCGPFSIKLIPGRVKRVYKCYICIFVCFVVKAIHLEIVNSLSTEAFIGALKRFISRRGRPSDIFSDNGTNFVGANNELLKILKGLFKRESAEKFEDFLASEGIKWHFNPPATPHFGGLWEAGVKSLKGHLKRVVGNTILTHEEFFTLVTQVEAVLNSRPLCPLSEDPNDDLALTPAHFLVGTSLTSLPEPYFKETPMNRLSRWELVQKLAQTFWSKWTSDYLNRLQARPKWYKGEKVFKKNEVVLVKGDDNSKLLSWNLAKIIEVHPGKDNITRIVTLKTSKEERWFKDTLHMKTYHDRDTQNAWAEKKRQESYSQNEGILEWKPPRCHSGKVSTAGRRVPDSKPDATEDPLCMRTRCNAVGQTSFRWCGAEVLRGCASPEVVLVIYRCSKL
ncbi:hypothetical protein AVEN_172970-1 [Araneus ventricosus]|uniref:Integrase catalytic domain-containing protein n=1 Tax=Araneus ventricosus TaxID=182803 RepID=A0A4Y2FW21_ARAVE|nr:hypothetical protein AVEN_172970-1 [Araneus ventricosus]